MRLRLYTIHSRGRTNELRLVAERRYWSGLIPPLWAALRGLWLSLAVILLAWVAVAAVNPALTGALWLALALLAVLEGAAIERAELRLRGWREVGMAEAASEVGAEELFLTGQAAGAP